MSGRVDHTHPHTRTQGVVSHKKRFQEEFSEEAHLPSKIKKPSEWENVLS